MEPSTEPCGTPYFMVRKLDTLLFDLMHIMRFERYDCSKFNIGPWNQK